MYYVIVLHDYLLLHDLTVFRINQDEFFESVSLLFYYLYYYLSVFFRYFFIAA